MSLFEIELNRDFQILNSIVFLEDNDFKKFYKLNGLNDGYDDDIIHYIDNNLLQVETNSLVAKRGYLGEEKDNFDTIIHFMGQRLNTTPLQDAQMIYLYPEWLLFLVAVKKLKGLFIKEEEFKGHFIGFHYIAEIRHKDYVIRNLKNFISCQDYKNVEEFQMQLYASFTTFLNVTILEQTYLFDFLNFLYKMHYRLKDREKYKLMWNLEIYIIEAIKLLVHHGFELKQIYLKIASGIRGTYAPLHDVYIYKPLYIEESKHFFQSFLSHIKEVFDDDISVEALMSMLTSDDNFEDLLYSYIELTKRFNANKRSDILMAAMIKGIVLGLEENIRDNLPHKPKKFDKCLAELADDASTFEKIRIKQSQYTTAGTLLELIEKLIASNENTLEKYLAVFYAIRNYVAHFNIDMDRFFWGNDGKRTTVSTLINAILSLHDTKGTQMAYRVEKVSNLGTFGADEECV